MYTYKEAILTFLWFLVNFPRFVSDTFVELFTLFLFVFQLGIIHTCIYAYVHIDLSHEPLRQRDSKVSHIGQVQTQHVLHVL